MEVRPLDPVRDRTAVAGLFARAADYVRLESGVDPADATVTAFFTDAPPGGDVAASAKLGLFLDDGTLAGIADLGFGFPDAADAYLGVLLFDPAHRGQGHGPRLLATVEAIARARRAPRLLLAVSEDNPRARAFWEREGFAHVLTRADLPVGRKRNTVHRLALAL